MNKLAEYIKSTRAEMKHVSWPTRKQAIIFTIIVIAISTCEYPALSIEAITG